MKKTSQSSTIANLQLLLKGLQANVPADTPLFVRGAKYTPATISAVVQKRIAALDGVLSARAALTAAVAASKASTTETGPILTTLHALLSAMFATEPGVLQQLGITPPKTKAKATSAQLLQRSLKAKATRAARNTMGSKQKAGVKGVGDTITVGPHPTASVTPSAGATEPVAAATAPLAPAAPPIPATPAIPPAPTTAAPAPAAPTNGASASGSHA